MLIPIEGDLDLFDRGLAAVKGTDGLCLVNIGGLRKHYHLSVKKASLARIYRAPRDQAIIHTYIHTYMQSSETNAPPQTVHHRKN